MKSVMEQSIIAVPLGQPLNVDGVLSAFARQAWAWYHAHEDEELWVVRKKITVWKVTIPLSITIHVRDAHPLMVRLFGEEPAT